MDSNDKFNYPPATAAQKAANFPSFISDPSPLHEFSHQHEEGRKVMGGHPRHDHADHPRGKIITGIETVPVTLQRTPFVPSDHDHDYSKGLKNAGVPRATIAATSENPHGTTKDHYASAHHHETVLQQHCAFFDRDKDGVLWPSDTYIGFRRIGYNILISLFAAFIIHVNFSYPTSHSILPDPFFRIWLDNIHKAKHGSDTDTYDSEGRFTPQHFEDFFEKYSTIPPDALGKKGELGSAGGDGGPDQAPTGDPTKKGLTYRDVLRGWNAQRRVLDPIGWSAEFLEWSATYLLLWPEDGIMRKEDVRRVYDGSIFWDLAEKLEREKMRKLGRPEGYKSKQMERLEREKKMEWNAGGMRKLGAAVGREKVGFHVEY